MPFCKLCKLVHPLPLTSSLLHPLSPQASIPETRRLAFVQGFFSYLILCCKYLLDVLSQLYHGARASCQARWQPRAIQAKVAIRPRERLSPINTAIKWDLMWGKERDCDYNDVMQNPYQRPTLPGPYSRHYWKLIPPYHKYQLRQHQILKRMRTQDQSTSATFTDILHILVAPCLINVMPSYNGSASGLMALRLLSVIKALIVGMLVPVVPECSQEQDRMLIDDYESKYLRHMVMLLTETDHQHATNDATLVLMSIEGHQQTALPFWTGAQQLFICGGRASVVSLSNQQQNGGVPMAGIPNLNHTAVSVLPAQAPSVMPCVTRLHSKQGQGSNHTHINDSALQGSIHSRYKCLSYEWTSFSPAPSYPVFLVNGFNKVVPPFRVNLNDLYIWPSHRTPSLPHLMQAWSRAGGSKVD
ncbi:hypothetical protein BDN67DRAFT_1014742 [Paxillus ammoniavirescens]|nr:hypothetical protein BDN67DRAFT_1014742 [Paxillus ammoniavirescens]